MGYIIKFNTPPEIREKIERKMQEMAKKMSEYCQVFHESSKDE